MKNVELYNYYQVLRDLNDSFFLESSFEVIDDLVLYYYLPTNTSYLLFISNKTIEQANLIKLLGKADINDIEQNTNLLKKITNPETFHENFLHYFSNNFYIGDNSELSRNIYSDSDASDKSSDEDLDDDSSGSDANENFYSDSDSSSSSDLDESNPYWGMKIEYVGCTYSHLE